MSVKRSNTGNIQYELYATIFVGGYTSLTPTEITAHLGIDPTKTSDMPLKRGAKRPPGWKTWFYSTLESNELSLDTINNKVHNLLYKIKDSMEQFRSLPDDCERQVVVTMFCDDLRPYVELSTETMKLLGDFTLSLRIALRCGPDDL